MSSRIFFGVLAVSFPSAYLVDCRVCGTGGSRAMGLLLMASVLLSDPRDSAGQTRWCECASSCPRGSQDCSSLGLPSQVQHQSGLVLAQVPPGEDVLGRPGGTCCSET